MQYKTLLLFVLGLCLCTGIARAQGVEAFTVDDIRVEGLQRITAGSVFNALPVSVGDRVSQGMLVSAAKTLFKTGNFDDIQFSRDENVLVVTVFERPSISEIEIEGNKAIETDALLDGLKGAGLAVGRVFKRSTLEGMGLELQRQYVSQGRYDAKIDSEVIEQPRNRVAVNINVNEGSVAKIKHINIVGNSAHNDEDLIDLFELNSTGWLSFISGNDKYSKEKLSGDLETLESFYKDRGYIRFAIDSTQVAITPDRDAVYITVNVDEGVEYKVNEVTLGGDIILEEDEMRRYLVVAEDQTFSQIRVTRTEEFITNRLGDEGYTFAEVNGIPEIDDDNNTVAIKFFVDPGKRTYVRRINFRGNTKTVDEVLRREMRQMESAPAARAKIEQSRIRLERLGFFKEVKVETPEVPGSDDLIDVEYEVEEQTSGSISASLGYAQDAGLLLSANLQQNNFLGTGKRVGIGVSNSRFQTSYNLSYSDPYYTEDGVSRGFSVFFRKTDLDEINISRFSTDTFGGAMSFGYPISETESLGFSMGINNTKITTGDFAVREIIGSPRINDNIGALDLSAPSARYIIEPGVFEDSNGDGILDTVVTAPVLGLIDDLREIEGAVVDPIPGFLDENGTRFTNFPFTLSWRQSRLNRGLLATRGSSQSLSFEFTVPGSDLEYYKLQYDGQLFVPITRNWTLRFRTQLAYGDGYGGSSGLPFFENFYSGGFGSVRGFKNNTLGPRSTPALRYATDEIDPTNRDPITTVAQRDQRFAYQLLADPNNAGQFLNQLAVAPAFVNDDPDPFGGNVQIEGSMELLFPLPFIKDRRSLRSAFFLDVGNVFNTECGATQVNCFDVDADELRYSVGVGLTWISGFGPLTFSLAKALNDTPEDETEVFQFSLGRSF
ncbi:MAG: outer membrane protein assembly factor BamA [Pseudomonadota bacterium]